MTQTINKMGLYLWTVVNLAIFAKAFLVTPGFGTDPIVFIRAIALSGVLIILLIFTLALNPSKMLSINDQRKKYRETMSMRLMFANLFLTIFNLFYLSAVFYSIIIKL